MPRRFYPMRRCLRVARAINFDPFAVVFTCCDPDGFQLVINSDRMGLLPNQNPHGFLSLNHLTPLADARRTPQASLKENPDLDEGYAQVGGQVGGDEHVFNPCRTQ